MLEAQREGDGANTEPQKLFLAQLLSPPSVGSASTEAVGLSRSTSLNSMKALQTSRPPSGPNKSTAGCPAPSRGQRWWEMVEADDDAGAEMAGSPSNPNRQPLQEICDSQTEVNGLKEMLFASKHELTELQAEHVSLSNALKRAREQWAVAADEVVVLKKENESLRAEVQQQEKRDRKQQKQRGSDAYNKENLEAGSLAHMEHAAHTVTSLSAELNKAQLALVSIVPELERRLEAKHAALERATLCLQKLELQLEEQKRADQQERLQLLSLLRVHAPEAAAAWEEANGAHLQEPRKASPGPADPVAAHARGASGGRAAAGEREGAPAG